MGRIELPNPFGKGTLYPAFSNLQHMSQRDDSSVHLILFKGCSTLNYFDNLEIERIELSSSVCKTEILPLK